MREKEEKIFWMGSMSVVRGQSSIRAFYFLVSGLWLRRSLRRNCEEERMRLIGSSSLWANQRFVRSAGCHIYADTHTHKGLHTQIYSEVDTEGGKSERQGGEEGRE